MVRAAIPDSGNVWTSNGPGVAVDRLAIDPSTLTTLYGAGGAPAHGRHELLKARAVDPRAPAK